ncbi:hypothetical protein ACVIVC_003161 [Sinorhizobium meliloti]
MGRNEEEATLRAAVLLAAARNDPGPDGCFWPTKGFPRKNSASWDTAIMAMLRRERLSRG